MMQGFDTPLPIDDVLPDLLDALNRHASTVLVAPPGAGKTTRVPIALLDAPWRNNGKILVLEPRRLAARGAATRMAATIKERVGERVGYRVRLGSKVSARTRIELVTEGIFTRMIVDDPALEGVAAVLFDEFHERSLDADLGLALALETQAALRPDLRLLVMSATLDGARIATRLGSCPVIESEGRAFPVETRYRPRDPTKRIEDGVVEMIRTALADDTGSLLVFLPGQGEIKRVADRLAERIRDPAIEIAPLYGAMDAAAQDKAVSPAREGHRKIVLATSIAETSLTIEGVRIVIDSGLARVPRYEPDLGLTRLETRRVSRASADQRRGRAGRTEPGICYRLWEEAATGALEPFSQPEILSADLSGLMMDCAAWGVTDPASLAFLDPPPKPALVEARASLETLGALDATGQITERGRAIRALPLPPRLARMVIEAASFGSETEATEIAAIIVERGLGGTEADLTTRRDAFRRDRSARAEEMRRLAQNWAATARANKIRSDGHTTEPPSIGTLLALAYPDRVAKARGAQGTFVMANGRAASVEPHDRLAREAFLAIAEIAGSAADALILLAAPLTLAEIETAFAPQIILEDRISFDRTAAALRARKVKRLGALILAEQTLSVPASEEAAETLAEGLATLGVARWPLSKATQQWRDRVMFLRRADADWPDFSDTALAETARLWLAPFLTGKTSLADCGGDLFREALESRLDWTMRQRLDTEAPTHFTAPTGERHAIDYEAEEGPVLAIRVQELYGKASFQCFQWVRRMWVRISFCKPAHFLIYFIGLLPPINGASTASIDAYGYVLDAARRYGVPTDLALSVAQLESGVSCGLIGHHGERGPLQILPSTARALGYGNIETSSCAVQTAAGMKHLALCFHNAARDRWRAAACHNQGLSAITGPIFGSAKRYADRVVAAAPAPPSPTVDRKPKVDAYCAKSTVNIAVENNFWDFSRFLLKADRPISDRCKII